jgi:hypothetical protein
MAWKDDMAWKDKRVASSDFLRKHQWIADVSDFGAVRIRRIRRRRKTDTSGRSPRSQAIAAHDVSC